MCSLLPRRRGRFSQRPEVRRDVRKLLALEGWKLEALLRGLILHRPAMVPHCGDQGGRRSDDVRGRKVRGDLASFPADRVAGDATPGLHDLLPAGTAARSRVEV